MYREDEAEGLARALDEPTRKLILQWHDDGLEVLEIHAKLSVDRDRVVSEDTITKVVELR